MDSKGNIVEIGEPGEIVARGYGVMLGYWGNEKQTKEAIRDGWCVLQTFFVSI